MKKLRPLICSIESTETTSHFVSDAGNKCPWPYPEFVYKLCESVLRTTREPFKK